MARIDFYVLPSTGEASRLNFACRLAEKAYRLQHTVHIEASDGRLAQQLDDLLWTFRDGSFVPHARLGAAPEGDITPVTIGSGADYPGADCPGANYLRPADLLINLADNIPDCLDSFARVAEIVTSDHDCRQRSRKRYAEYRSQGHALETHEL